MDDDKQYVYILDTYNKFEADDVVEIFSINSNLYALKRVKLYFGRPILSSIEKNENESIYFHLYESIDEAQEYIKQLKKLEGTRF